jgi:hypothetical protein
VPDVHPEKGLTPSERSLRARIAAFAKHSRYEAKESTRPARQAFLARFEREVDPDGVLSPEERARRAECARRAHFMRLAFLSAKARRKS